MERAKQNLTEYLAIKCQQNIDEINWLLNYRKCNSLQKSEMIRKKGFWKGMSIVGINKMYTNLELLQAKESFNNIIADLLTEIDINQIL